MKQCPKCHSKNIKGKIWGPQWCGDCGYGTGARWEKPEIERAAQQKFAVDSASDIGGTVNTAIPQKGLWYEIYDSSERDYGSDWGYVLYRNGTEIERRSGFSKIRQAREAARCAKINWRKADETKFRN